MENRVDWRIYYSDGSTFDSSMGDPGDVPAYGVICIPQPDEMVGRVIMHGWDWYYYVPEDKQWWGSDVFGVIDRLCHRLSVVALLQGRNLSNKDFASVMGRADKDPDFPPKSGKVHGESPHGA